MRDKKIIEFRCPNRPYDTQGKELQECRSELAGPALETLEAHDFSKPFIDIRRCSLCKAFYKITIRSLAGPVEYKLLPPSPKINFIPAVKAFGLISLEGRKMRKKRKL